MIRGAALAAGVIALLAMAGCGDMARPDQELRAKIFLACLEALPAGPQETKYNDWDEIVDSCEDAAYFQSLRGGGL